MDSKAQTVIKDLRKTILFLIIFISVVVFCAAGYFAGGIAGTGIAKAIKAQEELRLLKQEIAETKVEVTEDILSDWDMLQMAIVKTESDFKPEVAGESGRGIFQATSVYVAEVNRILGKEKYTHQDALDPVKSKEMFDVIQSTYNPDSLVAKAIQLHNPTGGEIYRNKVMQNLNFIRRYENIRRVIKQPL